MTLAMEEIITECLLEIAGAQLGVTGVGIRELVTYTGDKLLIAELAAKLLAKGVRLPANPPGPGHVCFGATCSCQNTHLYNKE